MPEYKMIGKNRFFLQGRRPSKRDATDYATRARKVGSLVRVVRSKLDTYQSVRTQRKVYYWEVWECPPNWQYSKKR